MIFKKTVNGNVLVEDEGKLICSYTPAKQVMLHPTTLNALIITDDSNPQESGKGLTVRFDSVDLGNCDPPIIAANMNELITALSSTFFFS